MSYILTLNEEQIAIEWEKYKGYTVRPLPSTIAYYAGIINNQAHNSTFFIYGGTPEIRSQFQQLSHHVVIADKSPVIVRAMGRLTRDAMPIAHNEHYVELDWLYTSLLQSKFDLLIGDDAINMVSWDYFDLFLKNAATILNPNGLFICHLLVQPDHSLIDKSFSDVMNEYKNGIIKNHYDLASKLNFICYDEHDYSMGWQRTINIIGKKQLQLFLPDFDFITLFGLCNSKFYCPPQLEFERIAQHYFSIEEIFYPHEYDYCLFEPVYVLKKL